MPPTPSPHLLPSCCRNELLLLLPTWSLHPTSSHLLDIAPEVVTVSWLITFPLYWIFPTNTVLFSHLEILLSWLHLPHQVQPHFSASFFQQNSKEEVILALSPLCSSFEPILPGIGPTTPLHLLWPPVTSSPLTSQQCQTEVITPSSLKHLLFTWLLG